MPKQSAFQKRLNDRLRQKRGAIEPKAMMSKVHAPSSDELAAAGDIHPRRYPEHEHNPMKGQIHGGLCNRTACDREGATWWNIYTFGLYCSVCGPNLNFADSAVCAPVPVKPTRAEMEDPVFVSVVAESAKKRIRTRIYG